jgi:hypothetical protein
LPALVHRVCNQEMRAAVVIRVGAAMWSQCAKKRHFPRKSHSCEASIRAAKASLSPKKLEGQLSGSYPSVAAAKRILQRQ